LEDYPSSVSGERTGSASDVTQRDRFPAPLLFVFHFAKIAALKSSLFLFTRFRE
jgi:hypothetical protein